jgi:hypothetical protein
MIEFIRNLLSKSHRTKQVFQTDKCKARRLVIQNKISEIKKTRILIGITLSNMGGSQKVAYDIIASLPESEYDVTVVSSPGGPFIDWLKGLNENRISQITIIELPCLRRDISPFNDFKAFFNLLRIISPGNFDIAHFHCSKMGILGPLAAQFSGVPRIFYTVHGWSIHQYMPVITMNILGIIMRLTKNLTTRIICVSKYDLEIGLRNKWLDPTSLTLLKMEFPPLLQFMGNYVMN